MKESDKKRFEKELGQKKDSPINNFELRSLGSQAKQRSEQTVAEMSTKYESLDK
ncbi:hypothetical protein [Dendrosporobacter sp. 1207_IL3150]|uniref:hypothetical protein n=1 Tax=Dendrosporobacter sp. 1207_IL3150 TaxID=3084054 RepID=UPI002FDB492F